MSAIFWSSSVCPWHRLRRIISAFVFAWVLSPTYAAAQATPCSSREECLTRSLARAWDTYAHDIEQRWQDLLRARGNLRTAEETGLPGLIAQAQQFLVIAEHRWVYARNVGQALVSPEVTATLQDNLIYSGRSLDMATSILRRQTDLYRGLQATTGAQRDGLARQLDGLAKDGIRMVRELFFTSLTDYLAKPGEWSTLARSDPNVLRRAFGFVDLSAYGRYMPFIANTGGALASSALLIAHIDRVRTQEPPPDTTLEALRPYAEIGQVVMPHLITAAQAAGYTTSATAFSTALLSVQFIGYGLDMARLGQGLSQMRSAQNKLDRVLMTESYWRMTIKFQGDKVAKYRAERSRSEDLIRRQAVIAAALQGKDGVP